MSLAALLLLAAGPVWAGAPALESLRALAAPEAPAPVAAPRAVLVGPGSELRRYGWFRRRFRFARRPDAAELAGEWRQAGWVTELPPKVGWHDHDAPSLKRSLLFDGASVSAVGLLPDAAPGPVAAAASARALTFRLPESGGTGGYDFECRLAGDELLCRVTERSQVFDGLTHYMVFVRSAVPGGLK